MVTLEGNSKLLSHYFQAKLGPTVRIAFFGDHYMSDVHAAAKSKQVPGVSWDAFAVIEELAQHDERLLQGQAKDWVDTRDKWGANYFLEQTALGLKRNYFVAEACKVARYALPYMRNIALWI